jgi:pimeloyl-ACP methyl ester carboxylesterase
VPFVESSDGTQIFYEVAGKGAPLILCAASFSTHRHWVEAQATLSRRLRVVTWDYRGHGRSEAPEADDRYSLAQCVEDLRAVHAAAAGDEPAVVGGLSMGGLMGLSYALTHPDRVRGLVLINAGPGFKREEASRAWREMLESAACRMEREGLDAYLRGRRAREQLVGLRPDSQGARQAVEGILQSGVAGLTRFARRVAGPIPNLVDELHRIAQPALILVGERDTAFQRAGEVMEAKLPNASRVALADAGHVLNLDQPEAFARQVEAFLEREGWL